jgi:hypothetical protein
MLAVVATPLMLALMQSVPGPQFGQPFVGPDGTRRVAKFSTFTEGLLDPHPDRVRRARYDPRRSALQTGAFPVPARGDEDTVEIQVRLDIDATGTPTGCQILRASGNAPFDLHVCPHLIKNLRHTPALDWHGVRVGDSLAIRVSYRFEAVVDTPSAPFPARTFPTLKRSEPRPLQPIDAAFVGLADADVPAAVTGVSGGLQVDAAGRVIACTHVGATNIDALDLRICQRLRTVAFQPQQDQAGRPVAGRYGFRIRR